MSFALTPHGVAFLLTNIFASLLNSITSYGDRPNEFDSVINYFRAHFTQVHKRNNESMRVLYTHLTNVVVRYARFNPGWLHSSTPTFSFPSGQEGNAKHHYKRPRLYLPRLPQNCSACINIFCHASALLAHANEASRHATANTSLLIAFDINTLMHLALLIIDQPTLNAPHYNRTAPRLAPLNAESALSLSSSCQKRSLFSDIALSSFSRATNFAHVLSLASTSISHSFGLLPICSL